MGISNIHIPLPNKKGKGIYLSFFSKKHTFKNISVTYTFTEQYTQGVLTLTFRSREMTYEMTYYFRGFETEEAALEAVKQDGMKLKFVKHQTENLCLEAVKQDGWALEYVENKTDSIILEAVKQNGHTLKLVENQTPELCLEAVKQDGFALQWVKDQTFDICCEAVKECPFAIEFIRDKEMFDKVAKELAIDVA